MFKYALTWFAAMGWHLWRIVTMRPAFRHLSDSAAVVFSFMAVYFVAGLLRWAVLAPATDHYGVLKVAFRLFLYMLFVMALFERKHRSSTLTASILGVSAVVDLLVSLGYLLGVFSSVRQPGPVDVFLLELVLTLVTVIQFNRAPEEVRRNGYRPSQHPELRTA